MDMNENNDKTLRNLNKFSMENLYRYTLKKPLS